jgi:hypothetical protein
MYSKLWNMRGSLSRFRISEGAEAKYQLSRTFQRTLSAYAFGSIDDVGLPYRAAPATFHQDNLSPHATAVSGGTSTQIVRHADAHSLANACLRSFRYRKLQLRRIAYLFHGVECGVGNVFSIIETRHILLCLLNALANSNRWHAQSRLSQVPD